MNRPQVLLLGNGLNLAYGGVSWSELLKEITVRDDLPEKIQCPLPLQAVLYTNNDIKTAMENQREKLFGSLATESQTAVLRDVLTSGFDEILTTNYSYELEMAALGRTVDDDRQIKKMADHTAKVQRVESKYLLHTYSRAVCNGVENRVWHIHGEARKPDSMILGHYYYANLLGRMIKYTTENENRYENNAKAGIETVINSWLDAFILGDVYVLGFSFDVSEFDLWWLLNRKLREKAPHGNTYFFNPLDDGFNEKIELLKLLKVEHIDCGVKRPKKGDPQRTEKYRAFYDRALAKIKKMMVENKNTAIGGTYHV